MRRSPMKRTPFRRSLRKSKHARRERAISYMLWVKSLPCSAIAIDPSSKCSGPIEADHAGNRFTDGDGTRAHDGTCIPLCSKHHRERHALAGAFKGWSRARMRQWLDGRIWITRKIATGIGIEVPKPPPAKSTTSSDCSPPAVGHVAIDPIEEVAPLPRAIVVNSKREP